MTKRLQVNSNKHTEKKKKNNSNHKESAIAFVEKPLVMLF